MSSSLFKFRSRLFLNYGISILLVTGAYLFVSFTLYKSLSEQASESILNQYLEVTSSRLDQLFRPIEKSIRNNFYLIQSGKLEKDETENQSAILSSSMLTLPQCGSVMMCNPTGWQFLVLKYDLSVYHSELLDSVRNLLPIPDKSKERYITRDFRPDAWGSKSEWTLREFTGKEIEKAWSIDLPTYDTKKRLWFGKSMEYLQRGYHIRKSDHVIPVTWTEVYNLYTTKGHGITAVLATITPELDTIFIAYDLLISDINTFTQEQDPTPNGGVFIFTDHSKMLGLPGFLNDQESKSTDTLLMKNPKDLKDPALTYIYEKWELDKTFAETPQLFNIDGERFWAMLKSYKVGEDKLLWIGVIIPEADLRLFTGTYLMIAIGFIGLLVFLFVSWRLSSSISKPLTDLVERNQRIASLDLGPGEVFETRTSELYKLYISIEKMRLALSHALSESKTATMHLVESEVRYRELVQKNVAGVFRATIQGKLIDCNRAFAKMFGYDSVESIIEVPTTELYHPSFPRSKYLEALLKTDILTNYEARYKRKDGNLVHALLNVAVVRNEEGEAMLVEGTIIDITDRVKALEALKQSEMRLELALEGAGQAVWESDIQTGEGDFEDLAVRMLGYSHGFIPQTFKGWKSLVFEGDWTDLVTEILIHLEGKSDMLIVEQRLKAANGEWKWIQTRGKVTEWNDDGIPLKATGTFVDVTEKKMSEQEKHKISLDLLHYNNELEHFAYITSHNLRAPVANLESLLSIYDYEGKEIEDNKIILQKITESVHRLSDTISDLNEIVAIKKDKHERLTILDLQEFLDTTIVSIQSQISKSGAEIKSDFSEAPNVLYVRSHMVSIFQNFLTNAIKYRHQHKEPEILIRSYRTNGYICLSIKDNGIGIDLNLYGNKLFELYQRFHPEYEGKGLGLYIVRAQVEMHGGFITVNSEVGMGTEFIVHFKVSLHGEI